VAEIQPYGSTTPVAIGLAESTRAGSILLLNQVLADTITLRDLYKKHHWQTSGPTFQQLHLLFDKHQGEQAELIDTLAERVMTLGGVSVAMGRDVAALTRLSQPPKGREDVATQLQRLLDAHEQIATFSRQAARSAAEQGDDGTNDLLVSQVLRTNESQAWFVREHAARGTAAADGSR
jgi:starvation-inducible DNA-binding protein